jgi:hypothetical protein
MSTHPFLLRHPTGPWREAASAAAEATDSGPVEVADARRGAAELRQKLLQLPAQTLVPRMGGLRGAPAWLAKAGFAVLFGALAVLAVGALAARREGRRPGAELVGTVLVALIASLALALACVKLKNRVPLQYFALTAWAWPLVFGALVDALPARRRAAAAAVLLAASATAGLGQALGAPREDLRGAVRLALEKAAASDAWITAVMWQPSFYARTTLFEVYAPEARFLEPGSVPSVLEEGGERPVVIVTRRAPDTGFTNWADWGPLQRGRKRIEATHFDGGVSVFVWGPR